MRIFMHIIITTCLMACGGKNPPVPAAEEMPAPPEVATAAAPEEAAPTTADTPEGSEEAGTEGEIVPDESAPEPELAPRKPDNADLNVTITFADGTTQSGHVRRTEVSKDWYGEKEWADSGSRLVVPLEAGGTEEEHPWTNIASINIKPGSVSSDTNCTIESDYTPWMYTCELKTTSTARTNDGRRYIVADRHKWRFFFDDDTELEFWLNKLPARMQDEGDMERDNPENYAIYGELQAQLRNDIRTMVKTIRVE